MISINLKCSWFPASVLCLPITQTKKQVLKTTFSSATMGLKQHSLANRKTYSSSWYLAMRRTMLKHNLHDKEAYTCTW